MANVYGYEFDPITGKLVEKTPSIGAPIYQPQAPTTPTPVKSATFYDPGWGAAIAKEIATQPVYTPTIPTYIPPKTIPVSENVTPAYKPRTETVLKTTLKDYITGAGDWLKNVFSGGTPPSQPTFDFGEGEEWGTQATPPGVATLEPLVGTLAPYKQGEQPDIPKKVTPQYYETLKGSHVQRPMTGFDIYNLPSYLTGSKGGIKELAMERVIQGVQDNWVTPENVNNAPENQLDINLSLVEHGEVLPQFYESQGDVNLAQFAKKIGNNVVYVPISGGRLDAVQDEASFKILWDTGYKSPKFLSNSTNLFQQASATLGIPFMGTEDPEKIKSMEYNSLKNALLDLTGQGKYSPQDLVDMAKKHSEEGTTLRLATSYSGIDAFGNPTYTAYWDTIPYKEPEKTAGQKEAEYWADWQTDYNHYWSPQQVAARDKQRQDSWEWSHNKDLEGWSEYYASLNVLKLPPYMSEWASSTTMFNDLRRIWETAGGGQSWEGFLANYDFWGKWYARKPSERGERPTAFAPIMTQVSKL